MTATDKTSEDSQGNTRRSEVWTQHTGGWLTLTQQAWGSSPSKVSQIFVVYKLLPDVQVWKLKPCEIWVNEAEVSLTLDSDPSACALWQLDICYSPHCWDQIPDATTSFQLCAFCFFLFCLENRECRFINGTGFALSHVNYLIIPLLVTSSQKHPSRFVGKHTLLCLPSEEFKWVLQNYGFLELVIFLYVPWIKPVP